MNLLFVDKIPEVDPGRRMAAEIFLFGEEKELALKGLLLTTQRWSQRGTDPQALDALSAGRDAIRAANQHYYPHLVMRSGLLLTDSVSRALLETETFRVSALCIPHDEYVAHAARPLPEEVNSAEVLYVGLDPTHKSTVFPPDAHVYIPETDRVSLPL